MTEENDAAAAALGEPTDRDTMQLTWKKESGYFTHDGGQEATGIKAYTVLCDDISRRMQELPREGADWAIIHRKILSSEPNAGRLLELTSGAQLLQEVVSPRTQDFTVDWFMYQNLRIGLLIHIIGGPQQGDHYLVAPNKFPPEFDQKVQFLRAMVKASDNSD